MIPFFFDSHPSPQGGGVGEPRPPLGVSWPDPPGFFTKRSLAPTGLFQPHLSRFAPFFFRFSWGLLNSSKKLASLFSPILQMTKMNPGFFFVQNCVFIQLVLPMFGRGGTPPTHQHKHGPSSLQSTRPAVDQPPLPHGQRGASPPGALW